MDEFLFNRSVSRNSSIGCSSRIYYYRSSEGVPFNWERQPGTPMNPPKEEVIPPITPPPAVISSGLPKPCIDIQQSKHPTRPRLRFWRKSKKNRQSKKVGIVGGESDEFDVFDFFSSDSEFVASTSPRNSTSSSSSSLSFSKVGHSRQCSSLHSTSARDSFRSINSAGAHLSCIPWKFSSVLVSITRRI